MNRKVKKYAGFITVIFVMLLVIPAILPYPKLDEFLNRSNSTRFYGSQGKLIYILPLKDGLRREYYPIEDIPEPIQKIFIIAEDKNFYFHPGINPAAFIRALMQNVKEKRIVSGASTITMQLARIIEPRKKNKKITLFIKLKECLNALRIEAKLSKKKILELYLNSLPFGFQIEGIGSAARFFYGKDIYSLNEAQMLALAVTPRRPELYSPLAQNKYVYEIALKIGKNTGFYVNVEEWNNLTRPYIFKYPSECRHYINWICSKYKNKKLPDRMDCAIDSRLNKIIEEQIFKLLDVHSNSRIKNAAAFVIENKTGKIIAWVGNTNFDEPENGQVDGVLAKHQAGSALKPFLYALALESGFTPDCIFADIPQDFGFENVYVPLNFNNGFNGPQRMRVCLASSLNIPAVIILNNIGLDNYLKKLYSCGFNSLKEIKDIGLSLALGSGGVTLYELVRAFSVFPCGGILPELQIEKEILAKKNENRVFEEDTARIICDFLSDKNARYLGFGYPKVFDTPYASIFKTGTSNQFQDITALGATVKYSAGVWMGNLNGDTVVKKTGSSIPAEIVRTILDYLTDEKSYSLKFKQPVSYKKCLICSLSGLTPNENCPSSVFEYTKKNPENCSWHFVYNGHLKIRYPQDFRHWASVPNMNAKQFLNENESIKFIYPANKAVFIYDNSLPDEVQMLSVTACGGKSETAELFVDSVSAGKISGRFIWEIPLKKGKHTLIIKCADETKCINYSVN